MSEEIIDAKFAQEMDLDRLLSECGEGAKLVVRRIEPEWCDGHLATIEIDPQEPLSMDSLKNRFGGRKLQFKIQKSNGDYIAHRTVKFPDAPRKDGQLLIQGQEHGVQPGNGHGQPGNGHGQNDKLFEMMLNGQRETSKMMIDALSARVNHLEASLQAATDRALGLPPATVAGQPTTPQDAFSGIRDSIKTIQEIEKFKEVIGVSDKPEPSMMETSLEKIMDFMLKKEEQKMEAAIARQAHGQTIPELPASSRYVPPQENDTDKVVSQLNGISDLELAAYVKKRLESMSETERMEMISQVADIDLIEEIDADENDNGQESQNDVQNEQGLPGVELTETDAERLNEGNNATPEPPLGVA